MDLKQLAIENFLSIGTIDLALSGNGLVLICGENHDLPGFNSNGSGKSSILEALVWVLFGKTIRDIPVGQVVNRFGSSVAQVRLDFDVNGSQYRLTRMRNVSTTTVKLEKDGQDISLGTGKRTQELIEEIIGMDFSTFTTSIVFGSGFGDFFTSLTDVSRKEILERILELEVFSVCQDVVKGEMKSHENAFQQAQAFLEKLTEANKQARKSLDHYLQLKEQRKAEIKDEILNSKKEMTALTRQAKFQQTERESLEKELAGIDASLKTYTDELVPKMKELDSLLSEATVTYRQLKRQSEDLVREVAKWNQETSQLTETYLNKPCPFCGRIVGEAELPVILASLSDKIVKNNQQHQELAKKIKELEGEISRLQEEDTQSVGDNRKKFDELLKIKSDLQKKIGSVYGDLKGLLYRINDLSKKIEAMESGKELKDLLMMIQDITAQMEKNEEEIQKHQKIVDTEGKELEVLSFWNNGFSSRGIKSWVINSYLPYLNERIRYYADKLGFPSADIQLVPVVQNHSGNEVDRIDLVVNNVDGGAGYRANSSGERRRIDLVILFALQDLVRKRQSKHRFNVFFYDEVFDTLDSSGCEAVVTLLQEQIQVGDETILIVSHNENLKAYFDTVWTVVKENGVSKLE